VRKARPVGWRTLGIAAVLLTVLSIEPVQAQGEQPDPELFISRCASCHGSEGTGTELGPSLVGVGAASADFYLRTGRMPLPHPGAPTQRKPVSLSDEEIRSLVDYVASLGEGPPIPQVDLGNATLSDGALLFARNCAACHGSTANGGVVGGNAFAPSLYSSTPLDVAEASLIGPGQMPVFDFEDSERNALVAYVVYLQNSEDPGGLDIGGIGPVPEGYVAWALAMTLLVVVILVVGHKEDTDE
jgi:ubiquinol-cytochrome c reductase cytochrome c subunit